MPPTRYFDGPWEALPGFTATRAASGSYTASHAFTMERGTWETTAAGQFIRGTPLTTLDANLPSYWSFLLLESATPEFMEGGFVRVGVEATGFNESEYNSDRETTYTFTGTLRNESIMTHPLFKKEVLDSTDSDVIEQRVYLVQAIMQGIWARDDREKQNLATEVKVYHIPSDGGRIVIIDNPLVFKWWECIMDKGNLTWRAPAAQWTRETTNSGGLTGDDMEDLGLIDDDPDGNPPLPFAGIRNWMKTSLTDIRGSDASNNTLVWEMSPPGGWEECLYGYDPSEVE